MAVWCCGAAATVAAAVQAVLSAAHTRGAGYLQVCYSVCVRVIRECVPVCKSVFVCLCGEQQSTAHTATSYTLKPRNSTASSTHKPRSLQPLSALPIAQTQHHCDPQSVSSKAHNLQGSTASHPPTHTHTHTAQIISPKHNTRLVRAAAPTHSTPAGRRQPSCPASSC